MTLLFIYLNNLEKMDHKNSLNLNFGQNSIVLKKTSSKSPKENNNKFFNNDNFLLEEKKKEEKDIFFPFPVKNDNSYIQQLVILKENYIFL